MVLADLCNSFAHRYDHGLRRVAFVLLLKPHLAYHEAKYEQAVARANCHFQHVTSRRTRGD